MFLNYYKAGEIHEIQANYGNVGRAYINILSQRQRQYPVPAAAQIALQEAVQVHPDMPHAHSISCWRAVHKTRSDSRGDRRVESGYYPGSDSDCCARCNSGRYAKAHRKAYSGGNARCHGKTV